METRILDGKKVGREIQQEVAEEIRRDGLRPGLTVVLVGEDPASRIYVRSKIRACQELGIRSQAVELPAAASQSQLQERIAHLNADDDVDGILVQLPLPPQIRAGEILDAIDPSKDVDGFHPVNMGRLCTGKFTLAPCTPMGIMEMLRREEIQVKGAEAVVVGRSDIVGKPMALLLLHSHATVTICHSRTRDLAATCRRADILVVAIGRPALVTKDFLKPGVVIVDVGMNRLDDRAEVERLFGADSPRLESFDKRGSSLVGDVHPRDPYGIASRVTPVPGGVGPLTIAHLMKNTLTAHRHRIGAAAAD